MRKITLLLALILITVDIHAQEKIPFDGDRLQIHGWASDLIIVGHDKSYIDILAGEDNESDPPTKYQDAERGGRISLLPNTRTVRINVPRDVAVDIKMQGVVFETYFDRDDPTDWREVSVEGVTGDIEFTGDGYHISLVDVSGGVAVVTYGDINASFLDLSNCEMISLDTYWGEVSASIPNDASIDLVMRAKSGEVICTDVFEFSDLKRKKRRLTAKLNGGRIPVLLHSEGGQEVTLSAR